LPSSGLGDLRTRREPGRDALMPADTDPQTPVPSRQTRCRPVVLQRWRAPPPWTVIATRGIGGDGDVLACAPD